MLRKQIKNSIVLFFALWLVSLIMSFIFPFYWGESTQATKFEYYKKNKEKFNAVYLGGSLEYRHINPATVDSICKLNGLDFHSFNMASDGHNIIQEMTDLDGLLAIDNPKLKYIFISISSEPYFFKANLHTSKWISWHTAKSTYRALRIIPTLKDDTKTKAQYCIYYPMSWMENFFKFGNMTDALTYLKNKSHPDLAYLGPRDNGFYPYDLEANHTVVEDPNNDKLIRASHDDFVQNKVKRDSLANEILKSFSQYKSDDKLNKAEYNLLMEAYKKCAKKKIQLIFMLPPKARTSYSFLLPLFHAMPEGTKIELADPRKYPELYQLEYGYNFHHLNNKGATLESKILGEQVANLLK